MHARSENLHDCARSAPEICAIFEKKDAQLFLFSEAQILSGEGVNETQVKYGGSYMYM